MAEVVALLKHNIKGESKDLHFLEKHFCNISENRLGTGQIRYWRAGPLTLWNLHLNGPEALVIRSLEFLDSITCCKFLKLGVCNKGKNKSKTTPLPKRPSWPYTFVIPVLQGAETGRF